MSELSPLSGVKLKSDFEAVRAAFDRRTKMLNRFDCGGYVSDKKMAPIKRPFSHHIFLSIFSIFFIAW